MNSPLDPMDSNLTTTDNDCYLLELFRYFVLNLLKAKDRKTAVIAAYKTGAYSQREIGEFYQLHPTTIGVILRKNKDS